MKAHQTHLAQLFVGIIGLFVFLSYVPTTADAAYPARCRRDCATPGSWCVEDGGGYECDDREECGPVLGFTPDCPSGCLCGWAWYTGGNLACGNKCITVLSCTSSSPTPTRTPTPEPMGTVRGRIIVDGVPNKAVGSAACGTAPEFPATISVTNPGNVSAVADKCNAGVPYYEAITTIRSHRVSAPDPPNMFVGYTACTDGTCHTNPPTPGDRVTLDVPAGGVDVWWHYTRPGTVKAVSKVSTTLDCNQMVLEPGNLDAAASGMQILPNVTDSLTVGSTKTWNNAKTLPGFPGGQQYTLQPTNLAGYSIGPKCYQSARGVFSGDTGYLDPTDTLTFHVGYTPPNPWVQVIGGDVYAYARTGSSIPDSSPKYRFNENGPGGSPGVVIYNTEFDIDSGDISTQEWIAQDDYDTTVDYYSAFYALLGSPSAPSWSGETPPASCSGIPCYAPDGPFTISTPWTIGSGEKFVILVDSNLTINSEIHVEDGGFLAFIVNGDINITGDVGTTIADSTEPQIEGVYVANGGFNVNAGTKKFVAEGMFIADSFSLDRDFETGDNALHPAELFLYGPRFLVTMPEEMSEALLLWSEVNP